MIEVTLNQPEFEYDIHSLIKAFYPSEYVGVSAEKKEYDEPVTSRMHVEYTDDAITLRWQQGETTPAVERTFAVDPLDRPETKNRLKQNLYALLSDATGQYLPWGTLTGIRPTKIPMKLLEEGKSRDEIYTYMKQTYFASDEKICLATDIAERELSLLSKIDYDNGYSLYIGIPFCPTTCLYCSFTSYPIASWAKRVDSYLDALEREIEFAAVKFAGRHLNSIYIGGGTPTTLEPYQLDRLIRKIKCSFDLSDCLEFTVEAGRPDSITYEKLKVLRQHGISRISINPQTMKQETLKLIGRHHTVEQTVESFYMARELGFDNINMDLVADCAAQMGLFPYYLYRQKGMAGNLENVGYAKEGMAGVYNVLIMEEKQTIVALGAGSITKRVFPDGRIERCDNVKDVGLYIEKIDEMIKRKRELFT